MPSLITIYRVMAVLILKNKFKELASKSILHLLTFLYVTYSWIWCEFGKCILQNTKWPWNTEQIWISVIRVRKLSDSSSSPVFDQAVNWTWFTLSFCLSSPSKYLCWHQNLIYFLNDKLKALHQTHAYLERFIPVSTEWGFIF